MKTSDLKSEKSLFQSGKILEILVLNINEWKNSKKLAEQYAKEYTQKEWIQYLVFYHEKFDSYIVHKEEHLSYFIKNLKQPLQNEKGQLTLTF